MHEEAVNYQPRKTSWDTVLEACLWGLILSIPVSKAGIEVFLHCGMFFWLIKRTIIARMFYQRSHRSRDFLRGFRLPPSALNKPLYSLAIIAFFSALLGVSIPLGAEGLFGKLYTYFFAYFLAIEVITRYHPGYAEKNSLDIKAAHNFFLILLFSMAVIILDGSFQFFTGRDFIRWYSFRNRLSASFHGPNAFAAWLITLLPLVLVLGMRKEMLIGRAGKKMGSVLLLLMGGGLLLLGKTGSRGAWLGYFVGMGWMGIILARYRRYFRLKYAVFTWIFLILPLVGLLFVPSFKERLLSIKGGFYSGGFKEYNWQEAIGIIEDFPLLGTGPNTYTKVGPYYKLREGGGTYPHNSYLHLAAEMGLLGLGAWAWIIARLLRTAYKEIKDRQDMLLLGCVAGLISFLVHSFFDTNLFVMQLVVLFWIMAGISVGLMRTHKSTEPAPSEK